MATHHVHERAPRPGAGEAGTTGDEPIRLQAHGHGGDHGDHGMLAMLACCIAIGAVFLLIALGLF